MEKYGISSALFVVSASDLSQKEFSMSLRDENTVNMIFMFYLLPAVESVKHLCLDELLKQ